MLRDFFDPGRVARRRWLLESIDGLAALPTSRRQALPFLAGWGTEFLSERELELASSAISLPIGRDDDRRDQRGDLFGRMQSIDAVPSPL